MLLKLRTHAVFSATKQMKRIQGHACWKGSFSVREGAKCNFKSTAQVYERCFFFMKWNVICNAEDRFHVLELFCRASHVRASMHRITSLELLKTLMMCLVQLSKWRECKAKDAEKLLLSERKFANAILRVTLSIWKMFLSHEMNVIAMQKTDFMFRAFFKS